MTSAGKQRRTLRAQEISSRWWGYLSIITPSSIVLFLVITGKQEWPLLIILPFAATAIYFAGAIVLVAAYISIAPFYCLSKFISDKCHHGDHRYFGLHRCTRCELERQQAAEQQKLNEAQEARRRDEQLRKQVEESKHRQQEERDLETKRRASAQGLRSMSPREFEREVAQLFQINGWRVSLTPVSGDDGVDIRINKENTDSIVQCKRYDSDTRIGPALLRELLGSVIAERAHKGYFVTTSHFTYGARKWNQKKANERLVLIDVDDLIELFARANQTTPGLHKDDRLLFPHDT